MKKFLLSLVMMSAMVLQAQTTITVDGFLYEVLGNNNVALIGDKGTSSSYSGDVVVPATIEHNGTTYTVTTIGNHAFYSSKVTSVKLPNTITTIHENSFKYSRELTTVNIPASVKTYIGAGSDGTFNQSIFRSCSKLKNVTLEEGLTVLAEFMFHSTLEPGTVINVPGSVKELPNSVFARSNASEVILHEGLEKVGDFAFEVTKNIQSITLPSTVKEVGQGAFGSCAASEINLNEGLTTIGRTAFSTLENLTTLVLPSTVSYIGRYAFNKSNVLTDLYIKATKVPESEYHENMGTVMTAFSGMAEGVKVHVPVGCLALYKADKVWGTLTNLDEAEAPSALESIQAVSGMTEVYDIMGRPQQQVNKGLNVTSKGLIWVK